MLVYRDTTYCANDNCGNKDCEFRLTDEIVDKAVTFGLPVSIADESENCNCYINKTEI